ncbi:hypothetical protein MAGR_54990 [Mycolicibacterium agri]|uniref:Uncharacterized protein n=1 Tax=Mycolicibacterium agri TaxID=36811 RepID=A0A7I9W9K7_MYCAG|nr:hypothetical protein MAGR_54990 [Mycolicibacterium agri]
MGPDQTVTTAPASRADGAKTDRPTGAKSTCHSHEYLRRNTTEGWIIDVSPEGQRPEVATRIFPGVQQPLAIAIFTRTPHCDPQTPAQIHYTAVHGHRAEKCNALAKLNLQDTQWQRTTWQARSRLRPSPSGTTTPR